MWLDIAIALSCCGCGLAAGWISHAVGEGPGLIPDDGSRNEPLVEGEQEQAQQHPQGESLAGVAGQLKSHISGVSANVDAHQSRVETINHRLLDSDAVDAAAISEAVEQLIEANQEMQRELISAQEQIHQQTLELEFAEKRAETDAMTKIPNRGAFDTHLELRHQVGPMTDPEAEHAGVLALLDVDHFKKFNDDYGHRAGDEVLKVVANLLHSRLNEFGLVARYGGEEFAVVLDGYDLETAAPIIDRARAAIGERSIEFEGQELQVTASAGVAQLRPEESIEGWLQRADDGLYQSKEAGRDCGHMMTDDGAAKIGDLEDPTESITDLGDEADSAGPLSSLPSLTEMTEIFDEVRERAGSEVEVSLMAVRCGEGVAATSIKSLLPIIRSNLRNVDRLGAQDERTLLICLPSIDEDAALQRGDLIRKAAVPIGFNGDDALQLGVVQAAEDETFTDLVGRVIAELSAE